MSQVTHTCVDGLILGERCSICAICTCELTFVNVVVAANQYLGVRAEAFIFYIDYLIKDMNNKLYSSLYYYMWDTVYPKKYAHGYCFAVLCCGYTLTDFPISIRLTSLALWQSNDCPSASKATLMNLDKYFMWIHYERLHNHNKAKHNKTVCIFLGIYCMIASPCPNFNGGLTEPRWR